MRVSTLYVTDAWRTTLPVTVAAAVSMNFEEWRPFIRSIQRSIFMLWLPDLITESEAFVIKALH